MLSLKETWDTSHSFGRAPHPALYPKLLPPRGWASPPIRQLLILYNLSHFWMLGILSFWSLGSWLALLLALSRSTCSLTLFPPSLSHFLLSWPSSGCCLYSVWTLPDRCLSLFSPSSQPFPRNYHVLLFFFLSLKYVILEVA